MKVRRSALADNLRSVSDASLAGRFVEARTGCRRITDLHSEGLGMPNLGVEICSIPEMALCSADKY